VIRAWREKPSGGKDRRDKSWKKKNRGFPDSSPGVSRGRGGLASYRARSRGTREKLAARRDHRERNLDRSRSTRESCFAGGNSWSRSASRREEIEEIGEFDSK